MKYLVAWRQKSLHYAVYEEVHYLHKESNHYYFNYMKYLVAWQKTLHYAGYEEVHYLHKESNHYYFNYEILGGMASTQPIPIDIRYTAIIVFILSSKIQKYISAVESS